jgi:hypothetical protein
MCHVAEFELIMLALSWHALRMAYIKEGYRSPLAGRFIAAGHRIARLLLQSGLVP